jgi:hypothetical protein
MKLLDQLRDQGFHSSIFTSFSCDLPFYETLVQSRLRAAGCLNNILLVDVGNYSRSVVTSGRLVNAAGRRYVIVPIASQGVFHPKIFLQLGEKKGRLLLGSANVSAGGFGSNRELVCEIVCSAESTPEQSLVVSTFDFLYGFLDRNVRSIAYKLNRIEADTPWLAKVQRFAGSLDLGADRRVGFLYSSEESIISQFWRATGGDRISRLLVLAPFWDQELEALSQVIELLKPERTILLIQPETVNMNCEALNQLPSSVEINDVGWPKERYLHAKLILAEGEKADHILMGSANCSVAALGLRDAQGSNVEACLYMTLPSGESLETLSLSDKVTPDKALDPEAIQRLIWRNDFQAGSELPYPGHLELIGTQILWWPSPGFPTEKASLNLLDENLNSVIGPIPISTTGLPSAFKCGSFSNEIRFGQVLLGSGDISSPVYVQIQEELRRAAPGPAGARLNDILEKIRIGESGFLDLLEPFERILFNPSATEPKHEKRGRPGSSTTGGEDEINRVGLLPYEEFLAGREKNIERDKSAVASEDLDIALLIDFLMKYFAVRSEAHSDELVSDEMDEETGEFIDTKSEPNIEPTQISLSKRALERTRNRVAKLVDRYLEWTQRIRIDSESRVTADDVASLWSLLALISYLCDRPVELEDGEKGNILFFNDQSSILDFPLIISRILGNFFMIGNKPPVRRLYVPELYDELPAEYLGAWSASCWALCAAMHSSLVSGRKELQQDLESLGYAIYEGIGLTCRKIDEDEILKTMMRIHDLVGIEAKMPLERLKNLHHWFMDMSVNACAPNGWTPTLKRTEETDLRAGDRVWAHLAGPRYVRRVEGDKVYLNKPGANSQNEKENFYRAKIGYVVAISSSKPPES